MHSAEVPSFKKKWITVLSKELNLCTITNADFLYTKGENSPLSLQIWNGISEQKFGSHGDGHGAEPNRVWAQSALVDDPKIHHPWAYSSANKVKPFLTTLSSSLQVTGSLLERYGISPQILLFQPCLWVKVCHVYYCNLVFNLFLTCQWGRLHTFANR